jgi:hypothetical protein
MISLGLSTEGNLYLVSKI